MNQKARSFVAWTFALSYLYAALFYFVLGIRSGTGYLLMAIGYMWIPGTVAIAHGSLNASIGISFVYITGGHVLWNGFHHLSGFVLLALVNLVMWKSISSST